MLMKNEKGVELKEEQLIKLAMDDLMSACECLFETNTEEGHAAAFMADNLLKYLTTIYHGKSVLSAATDYNDIEQEIYDDLHKKKKKSSEKSNVKKDKK
jgi:ABC-type Fe2+-enterobactin transport system substrate-binding protein